MNPSFEFAARSLLIGAGATLAIDAWAAVLRRFGIPSLRIELLGRWIGAGIASLRTQSPVRNALKSLLTHTVFGIGLFLAAHATAPLLGAGN